MITITIKDKKYELADETFEVLSKASVKYLSGDGELKIAEAGQIVFDALYTENEGSLIDIKKDVHLYFNLCIKAAELVEFFEGELKKN